jgi:hypothetical protein
VPWEVQAPYLETLGPEVVREPVVEPAVLTKPVQEDDHCPQVLALPASVVQLVAFVDEWHQLRPLRARTKAAVTG